MSEKDRAGGQVNESGRVLRRGGRGGGQGGGPMGALMSGGQKAKDFKGTILKLINYLKPSAVLIIIVMIFSALSTVFGIYGPKKLGEATDKLVDGVVNSNIDFPGIAQILLFLVGLYVASSFFSFIQSYVMAGVTQRTVYKIRKDISAKLNRLPIKYFDHNAHGDILSRVSNDVDNISNTLQQSLTQIISSVVTLTGILVMMLSISPVLTLISILTLPLAAFVTMFVAKRSQKYFKSNQEELGNINGHIEEICSGHKIVKAYAHEERAIAEFEEINERLYEAGWKSQFFSGIIMPALGFVSNLGYVAVCIAGGMLANSARITIGGIQAFIMYSKEFTQPISQVANIMNILQSTAASAERVFEMLEEAEEMPDAEDAYRLENLVGEVSFEHVRFGYSDENILMEDININVKPGQTIAIVGPTGAGKTTFVNLLMRFYELQGGKISIDGHDITSVKRGSLRNAFGMVLQDTWLFNGSIKDNIAYSKDDATFDEVYAAAKLTHVDRFVRVLPNGYDTILNEEASNFSLGQRQLITITRAILADPAILILDEATSSVDTRTELLIQKAMGKLMKGRTSFVIAHRLSTIKNADLILVMDHGRFIEQGTHEELMAKNGFYTELYNSQFARKSA